MKYSDFVDIGVVPAVENPSDPSGVVRKHIGTCLLAYAAGDAIGVEYEMHEVKKEVKIERMGTRDDWPFGGVSDDTLLSILTLETFSMQNADKPGEVFLEKLREALPKLRGLGPTTRYALGMPLEPKDLERVGNTNGALMRTSLLGIAYGRRQSEELKKYVYDMAFATHRNSIAAYSAVLMAALFSEAFESNRRSHYEVLKSEIEREREIPSEFVELLENFQKWTPPARGISLDSIETLMATIWVVERAEDCLDAYRLACELGGDTDTVAAQSGALFCAENPNKHDFFSIPWLDKVDWNEVRPFRDMVSLLALRRSE